MPGIVVRTSSQILLAIAGDIARLKDAALICLARRRCDVIYAILKTGSLYQPQYKTLDTAT